MSWRKKKGSGAEAPTEVAKNKSSAGEEESGRGDAGLLDVKL